MQSLLITCVLTLNGIVYMKPLSENIRHHIPFECGTMELFYGNKNSKFADGLFYDESGSGDDETQFTDVSNNNKEQNKLRTNLKTIKQDIPYGSRTLETFYGNEKSGSGDGEFYDGSGYEDYETQITDNNTNNKDQNELKDLLRTNMEDVSSGSGIGEGFRDDSRDDGFHDGSGSGNGETLSYNDNNNKEKGTLNDVTTLKSPADNGIVFAEDDSEDSKSKFEITTKAKRTEPSVITSTTHRIYDDMESSGSEFEFSGSESDISTNPSTTGADQAQITAVTDDVTVISNDSEGSGSETALSTIQSTTGTDLPQITSVADDVIIITDDPEGSGRESDLSTIQSTTETDLPRITSVADDVIIISDDPEGSGRESDLSTIQSATGTDLPQITSVADDVIIISDDSEGSGRESDLSTIQSTTGTDLSQITSVANYVIISNDSEDSNLSNILSTATGTDKSTTTNLFSEDVDGSGNDSEFPVTSSDENGISKTATPNPEPKITRTILYKILTSKEGIELHNKHGPISVDDKQHVISEHDLISVQKSHIVTDTLQKDKTTQEIQQTTGLSHGYNSQNWKPLHNIKMLSSPKPEQGNKDDKDTITLYLPITLVAFGLTIVIIAIAAIFIPRYRRRFSLHFKTLKEDR